AFRQREFPIGAATLQALQVRRGAGELDLADHDVARQQRQRRQAELRTLQRRQVRRLGPSGVGNRDVFHADVRPWHPTAPALLLRGASPLYVQVTIDGERPPDGG